MSEELYNDGLINTETEKRRIEYRPNISYNPERPFTVNTAPNIVSEEDNQFNSEVESDSFFPSNPVDTYDEFLYTNSALDSLEVMIREEINQLKIPVSFDDVSRLVDSGFSGDLSAGEITFEMYDQTFADPEDPANSLIQDIVTAYAEDMDGNLELELYEDVRELQESLKEGYFLFKESVLSRFSHSRIPELQDNEIDFSDEIEEHLHEFISQFNEVESINERTRNEYYEALRTSYGTPEYYVLLDNFKETKRRYDLTLREKNLISEMLIISNGLVDNISDCTNQVRMGLVRGSDIDSEGVMTVLSNQASSEMELAGLMKLSQISLKLQANKQIQEKRQYRDTLKNINNLSRQKRVHDELLECQDLRDKMFLSMYDTLQHLESPSKEKGVESFLNQIAGGLEMVQEQYVEFMNSAYSIHASEYEIRRSKIGKVMEKENARAGYLLVSR